MTVKSFLLAMLLSVMLLSGCDAVQTESPASQTALPETSETESEPEETEMKLWIGETEVPVTWEDNDSVGALRALAQGDRLTISMSIYGGFEQVGAIGRRIARNDTQTTTAAGDIVLYSGNQIVIFYGSNSWAYTRLGHVELSAAEMTALLGSSDATITIQTEE